MKNIQPHINLVSPVIKTKSKTKQNNYTKLGGKKKNSGDLMRIVIYTLTLNKKCLGRFV